MFMKSLNATAISFFLVLVTQVGFAQDCTLTCPDNIIVKTDEAREGAVVYFPEMKTPDGCGNLVYTPASGSFFRLGSHSVIITSSTGKKCSFTVTVTDNEPPNLSLITLSRTQIWPASNKMKKVKVYYTASDNAQDVKTKISVSSNAATQGGDYQIEDDHLVRLRSSRLPDGSARIYTITVTATDGAGNKTTRTKSITVMPPLTAAAN